VAYPRHKLSPSPDKLRGLGRAAAPLVGASWARHKGGASRGACSPQLVLAGKAG